MTISNQNAFPNELNKGLTKREYITIKVLNAIIISKPSLTKEFYVRFAIECTDELIKQLNQKET